MNFNLLLKREKMRLRNSSNGKISRVTAIRALMSLIRERMPGKTTIRKSESLIKNHWSQERLMQPDIDIIVSLTEQMRKLKR